MHFPSKSLAQFARLIYLLENSIFAKSFLHLPCCAEFTLQKQASNKSRISTLKFKWNILSFHLDSCWFHLRIMKFLYLGTCYFRKESFVPSSFLFFLPSPAGGQKIKNVVSFYVCCRKKRKLQRSPRIKRFS